MTISILGAGAWGTAIAISLSDKRDVILWTRNESTFNSVREKKENERLPNCNIPNNVSIKLAIGDTINTSTVILAIPTQSLREVCEQLRKCKLQESIPIIIACKGIEKSTLRLPSEIVNEVLPNNPVAIFSGPSFAIEVAKKLPCFMVLACKDNKLGSILMSELQRESIKLYLSNDVIGVQICAALKNIFAIACGIILGKGLGYNAHAALITKSMNEVSTLYSAKVGSLNMETILGPSCLGDLVLTCTSLNSRNLSFGFKIGSSDRCSIQQVLLESRSVIEGIGTAESVFNLAEKLKIKMPICEAVYKLLCEGNSLEDTIAIFKS